MTLSVSLSEKVCQAVLHGKVHELETIALENKEVFAREIPSKGVTPIELALTAEDVPCRDGIVRTLLDNGADPNTHIPPRRSVLDLSMEKYNATVKRYYKGFSAPSAQDYDMHQNIVLSLFLAGADIFVPVANSEMPLAEFVVRNCDTTIVQEFLQKEFLPLTHNSYGRKSGGMKSIFPLLFELFPPSLVLMSWKAILKRRIKRVSPEDARIIERDLVACLDTYTLKVWESGELKRFIDIASKRGERKNADTKNDAEIVPDIFDAITSNDVARVHELAKEGYPIDNIWDELGRTPLSFAIQEKRYGCAKALLMEGAHPDTRTKNGVTPLMLSATTEHFQATLLLMSYNADVNAVDKHGDPIITRTIKAGAVAGYGAMHLADIFINAGIDIDKSGNGGKTPLMAAIIEGNSSLAETLILMGADIAARDNDGYTALTYAVEKELPDVVKALFNAPKVRDDKNLEMAMAKMLKEKTRSGKGLVEDAFVTRNMTLAAELVKNGAEVHDFVRIDSGGRERTIFHDIIADKNTNAEVHDEICALFIPLLEEYVKGSSRQFRKMLVEEIKDILESTKRPTKKDRKYIDRLVKAMRSVDEVGKAVVTSSDFESFESQP